MQAPKAHAQVVTLGQTRVEWKAARETAATAVQAVPLSQVPHTVSLNALHAVGWVPVCVFPLALAKPASGVIATERMIQTWGVFRALNTRRQRSAYPTLPGWMQGTEVARLTPVNLGGVKERGQLNTTLPPLRKKILTVIERLIMTASS